MAAAEKQIQDGLDILYTKVGTSSYFLPMKSLSDESIQAAFVQAIDDSIKRHEIDIYIDASHMPVVNSQVLEVLLSCYDKVAVLGGQLHLTKANSTLREVFKITGLNRFVDVVKDVNETDDAAIDDTKHKRLGDMLIENGFLTAEQADEAIASQGLTGRRMGEIVVEKGWVSEDDMALTMSQQLGIPFIHLKIGVFDIDVQEIMPLNVLKRLKIVPLFKVRQQLVLGTTEPQSIQMQDEVHERTGLNVLPVLVRGDEIKAHLDSGHQDEYDITAYINDMEGDLQVVENKQLEDFNTIDEMASGSPVINLVNAVIQRAIRDGASDVHIEPSRSVSRIRFRIDGILYEFMTQAIEMHAAIVSRLKVMANLDIAERRLPQDGRVQVNTQGRSIDLRFSSLPGIFGEKIVMRVLDKNQSILDIQKLGMQDANLTTLETLLAKSHGLVLTTGPTGSGKTTTLYAGINHLNSIEKSIVTIEDPVEYQLDIINQNQVNEKIGLSFSRVLRHVLRQDPDIVMVGEIRDKETAEIAVQAALTGHLVLSTLHTNQSVGAITRLVEMGVEPYLLSSALVGVVAQRLIRTICPDCKTTYVAPPAIIEQFGWQDKGQVKLSKGRGCGSCYDSGYKGRMAVHEILVCDDKLQQLMTQNPTREQLLDHMKNEKVKTLFEDGLARVLEGKTTLDEISRVLMSD